MAEQRLIVFDWDGTLLDSTSQIVASARASIAELGLPERDEEEIRNIIGLGFPQLWEILYPKQSPETFREFVKVYRRHFWSDEMQISELYPGARELLDELRAQQVILAIATGKGRKGLDMDLAATQLAAHFRFTCTADDVKPKPQPDMLFHLMAVSGCEPEQSLMIGDTEYDLEMACCAGVPRVGIGHGAHAPERLERWDPLKLVEDLPELHDWLNSYLNETSVTAP